MARIFILYKRVDTEEVFNPKKQLETYTEEKCWNNFDGIESNVQFKVVTYKLNPQPSFTKNTVYLATDGIKKVYICVNNTLVDSTVDYFMEHPDTKFICIECALDSTKKFNLKNQMQDKFFAF